MEDCAELAAHSLVCAKNESNMCIICEGYYSSNALLRKHAEDCSLKFVEVCPPGLKCPECDKEYTLRWNLLRHYKEKHTEEASYRCTACQEFFQTEKTLRRHKREKHGEGQNKA